MARLSYKPGPADVAALIARATPRLTRAGVFYGHGTDNARDEAVALVFHVMKLSHDSPSGVLKRRVSPAQRQRFEALLSRRIEERVPLAYLTHEAWFAGLKFHVDERVLVPRSAIAELTERALMRAYPRVPFTWLDFERGGGGVFLLTREQLQHAFQ